MMGERVPTETDLRRVADSVNQFAEFWLRRIEDGTIIEDRVAERVINRFAEFHRTVKLVPYPSEFFIAPKQDGFSAWQGWTRPQFNAFELLLTAIKDLHNRFSSIVDRTPMMFPAFRHHWRAEAGTEETKELIEAVIQSQNELVALMTFVPCEVQIDILEALNGKSLTKEKLCESLIIGQTRLYGNRDKNGGLYELMRLDLVRNGADDDSGIRGYYRPDFPPE